MSLKNKSCEPTTSQRVYVFIDAANIWKVFKAKRSLFDLLEIKADIWGKAIRHRPK